MWTVSILVYRLYSTPLSAGSWSWSWPWPWPPQDIVRDFDRIRLVPDITAERSEDVWLGRTKGLASLTGRLRLDFEREDAALSARLHHDAMELFPSSWSVEEQNNDSTFVCRDHTWTVEFPVSLLVLLIGRDDTPVKLLPSGYYFVRENLDRARQRTIPQEAILSASIWVIRSATHSLNYWSWAHWRATHLVMNCS